MPTIVLCVDEPCLHQFEAVFAVDARPATLDQHGNLVLQEESTIAKVLEVAAADPIYAPYLPMLRLRLGRRALRATLIDYLEQPCLRWLDDAVPRLQDSHADACAAMEAMPPQQPPLQEVLSAAAAKVQP